MSHSDQNTLEIFQAGDTRLEVRISPAGDTVWLTRHQLADLYGRDVKTIGKHIANALKEEMDTATVAKFATVASNGKVYQIEHYNLDMVMSIGYRVKSPMGVQFRRWANTVLREYVMKGYAINAARLEQLDLAVRIMRRLENSLDAPQVLDIVSQYTKALSLLDDYDHHTLSKPEGQGGGKILTYEECRVLIDAMKVQTGSDIFGNEKDDSFRAAIGDIYQSFGGKDLYPSIEEKAANLLYFVTKNHAFSDGNKRIAAAVFIHFLKINGILQRDGSLVIANHTLVAIIVMIAESAPQEKETMTRLVMNFLVPEK